MDPARIKRFSLLSNSIIGRRGITPPRVGYPTKPVSPKPPKPRLTNEQLLKALERIENRDFTIGAGAAQFYDEPTKIAPAKNLLQEFERAEDPPKAVNDDSADVDFTFYSLNNFLKGNEANVDVTSARYEYMNENLDNYGSFPSYVKSIDKLIVLQHNSMKHLMTLCERRAKTQFHRQFPQKIIENILRQLDEVALIIYKFQKKPVLERMRYFVGRRESIANVGGYGRMDLAAAIRCDIEEQSKFITCFEKIQEIIEQMRTVLDTKFDKQQLSGKIKTMKKLIDSTEKTLHLAHSLKTENHEILDIAEEVEMFLEYGSSSGSLNQSTSSSDASPLDYSF